MAGMAKIARPAGDTNRTGVKGAPLTPLGGRVETVQVPLARYKSLTEWVPELSDFIIYHGWLSKRWYGVVSGAQGSALNIVRENLPILLFNLTDEEQRQNTITLDIGTIKSGKPGEYHVLQNGVWFV